jgi:pheromone shutdown protein TraB
MPSVWKEESMVLMRSRVWLARGGREIAGGEHLIVKAAQDEAISAALRRKTPEAQDLLLAEREGVLRRNLPEVHDAGSAHPCDGWAMAVAAIEELIKCPDRDPCTVTEIPA